MTPKWNDAVGPQSLRYYHRNNDTNVEFIGQTNAQMDQSWCANPGCYGFTRNCPVSGACGNYGYVFHSYIYVASKDTPTSPARIGSWSGAEKKWLLSHEFGHALGLAHIGSGCTCSVMYTGSAIPLDIFAPTHWEIGEYPSGSPKTCTAATQADLVDWGTLCVYFYTNPSSSGALE